LPFSFKIPLKNRKIFLILGCWKTT